MRFSAGLDDHAFEYAEMMPEHIIVATMTSKFGGSHFGPSPSAVLVVLTS